MQLLALVIAASIAVASPGSAVLARETLEYGDTGATVQTLNEKLRDAGFHPDEGDTFGRKTRHAVYAFQKHHQIPVTGSFSPLMWALLDEPVTLPPHWERDRIEVDLDKQVLYVVEDQEVVLIVPISSGSGNTYVGSNGRRQKATTPEGEFTFERRVRGTRRAPLGTLYYPYYFKGGIAVHGSPSVPNRPASHGCIRVTMWDMDVLREHFHIGQTILVYGHETPRDPGGIPDSILQLI